MKLKIVGRLSVFGLLASASWLAAAEPAGDQILREMSGKLAAAKTFSFEATREIDPALLEGLQVQEKADVAVTVQRPNKLAAHGVGKAGSRRIVADGQTLYILDEKENNYSAVPMHTTLDGLVDQLDKKYGYTPPLAEFTVSNPYKEFHNEADAVGYVGREKLGGFLGLGGVECHHLSLKGKEADAELWIGVADQLPHKLVATFHRAGNPQVHVVFHKWNLAATVTPADFKFAPPAGAEKIEMWTTAQMEAARKN